MIGRFLEDREPKGLTFRAGVTVTPPPRESSCWTNDPMGIKLESLRNTPWNVRNPSGSLRKVRLGKSATFRLRVDSFVWAKGKNTAHLSAS